MNRKEDSLIATELMISRTKREAKTVAAAVMMIMAMMMMMTTTTMKWTVLMP